MKANSCQDKPLKVIWNILYALCWAGYLGCLTYVILFKASWDQTCAFMQMVSDGTFLERRKAYLHLFESTLFFIENWQYAYARWNIFGNILLFIPFGILSGASWGRMRGLLLTFLASGLASLGYELIQYLYAIGEFDVDDIMWNVAGAVSGYLLVQGFQYGRHILCRRSRESTDAKAIGKNKV